MVVAIAFGSADAAAAASGCKYQGGSNALPTSGAPALVYANGNASPSGFIGISDGSGDNYGQLSGDSSGGQLEGNSTTLGQSGWVRTDGSMGSC
jgi:hypothetical protein